jgi:hypothetical protein
MPYWLVLELEAIPGWTWDPIGDRHRWNVEFLTMLVRRTGLDVGGVQLLANWIIARRLKFRTGRLSSEESRRLTSIPNWTWPR